MNPKALGPCSGMRASIHPSCDETPRELIETAARALLGAPNEQLSSAKELRFGRRGSLSVNLERGVWYSFETGTSGGVLDLVTNSTSFGPSEAKDWLRQHLHRDLPSLRVSCQESNKIRLPASASRLERYWRDVWLRCRPLTESSAPATYLDALGCRLPHQDGDLRWIPGLKHPSGWTGPALVALITDARSCEPMSLHRTWIHPTCPASKAPVTRPRLLLKNHRKTGGCVRLWPDAEVTSSLAVAEGIENALAAARGFRPVWATIDAGNLASFPLLPGLEAITIIADHDRQNPHTGRRVGIEAARKLARRYVEAGFDPEQDVRIWAAPSEGTDFADLAAEVIEE